MPQYGEVRVDYITYTTGVSGVGGGEANVTVDVSGLANSPTFSGGIIVSSGTVSGDLTVSGNLNANTITATGEVNINNNLTVTGELTVTGDGNFNRIVLPASGDRSAPSLTFSGDEHDGLRQIGSGIIELIAGPVASNQGLLKISNQGNGSVTIGSGDESSAMVPLQIINPAGTAPEGVEMVRIHKNTNQVGDQRQQITFRGGTTTGVEYGTIEQRFNTTEDWGALGIETFVSGNGITENLTIDHLGNVGINNTNPQVNLDVSGVLHVGSGTAAAPSLSFQNDGDTGIYNPSGDFLGLTCSGTEVVRIFPDNIAGHMAIGTDFAAADLHVRGGNFVTLMLETTGGATNTVNFNRWNGSVTLNEGSIGHSSAGADFLTINARANGGLGFRTPSATQISGTDLNQVYIASGGNVGINTSTPQFTLDVSGTCNIRNDLIVNGTISGIVVNSSGLFADGTQALPSISFQNDTALGIYRPDFGSSGLAFTTSGTEKFRILGNSRALMGVNTDRNNFYGNANAYGGKLQIEGVGGGGSADTVGARGRGALTIVNNNTGGNPAFIALATTRGTSVGSMDAVQNGDWVSSISAQGANGTYFNDLGSFKWFVDGNPTQASGSVQQSVPGRLEICTALAGTADPVRRISVRSDGRVITHGTTTRIGINNANPGALVALDSQIDARKLLVYESNSAELGLGIDSNTLRIFTNGDNTLNGIISFGKVNTQTSFGYEEYARFNSNRAFELSAISPGISFANINSATNGAAATTVNSSTLDSYEVGTFDPRTQSAAFTNMSLMTGRYIKIGRLVNVDIRVKWDASNGSTASFELGLPYVADTGSGPNPSTRNPAHTGLVFYEGTTLKNGAAISSYVGAGQGFMTFYSAGGGSFSILRLSEITGAYDWLINTTYHASV